MAQARHALRFGRHYRYSVGQHFLLQLLDPATAIVGRQIDGVVGDVDLGFDNAVLALVHPEPARILGQEAGLRGVILGLPPERPPQASTAILPAVLLDRLGLRVLGQEIDKGLIGDPQHRRRFLLRAAYPGAREDFGQGFVI